MLFCFKTLVYDFQLRHSNIMSDIEYPRVSKYSIWKNATHARRTDLDLTECCHCVHGAGQAQGTGHWRHAHEHP